MSRLRDPQSAFLRGQTALQERADLDGPEVIAETAHGLATELDKEDAERGERACARGCTACCHFVVGVRPAEAVRLARAIDAHPERERMLTALRRAEDRSRSDLASCPLLNARGDCSVHDARPLPCRGWTARERQWCDAHLEDQSIEPRPGGIAFALHLGLGAALDEWHEARGLSPGPFELTTAVLAVFCAGASSIDLAGLDLGEPLGTKRGQ